MTAFEGFPMPADYPHFPRRDQVRTYIESYARHHDRYDLITFDTEVASVTPEPSGPGPVGSAGWRVITSRGDEGVFDGVLIANRHLCSPRVPTCRVSSPAGPRPRAGRERRRRRPPRSDRRRRPR
jgi:cation diffusion facilitator CzcD-associated flavoprotein CzcO